MEKTKAKRQLRIFTTVLACAALACACENSKDDNPPAKPASKQGEPGKPADQQKQATNDQGAPTSQSSSKKAPAGALTAPIPNESKIPEILNAQDDTTSLLRRMFVEVHEEQIEAAGNRLVDEVFSDEGEAQGKIVRIQASIAELAKKGAYTPEAKHRVAFLQSKLMDRIRDNQYTDVLEKGVFFVATGAVLGTIAGTGAYKNLPEIGQSIKASSRDGLNAFRSKMSDLYAGGQRAYRDVASRVSNRESFQGAVNSVRDTTSRLTRRISDSAGAPFRPAETLVRDTLDDLGVTTVEGNAIRELAPVPPTELPTTLEWKNTPKSTLQYSVLDHFQGEDLGIERRLVFRQDRLVRGSHLQTTFVSNPMPADIAGSVAARLEAREIERPERMFVHFANLKTGAVSALRWPVAKFNAMLESANARVRPLFMTMDVPTAVGTGVTTAGAMGIVYWWGAGNGESIAEQKGAANLENMIQRDQPNGPVMSLAE